MSDSIISVKNLSKSYLIGHQGAKERYTSLRDTVAQGAKSIIRKTCDFTSMKQMLHGDTVEEFWALQDVSFEVKQGEVLGIIGRNGAGKSTLLKVLSRITEPTSGRVTLRGRVASLLEVGTGFHPELTGRENLYLNGAILGMRRKEIDRKFDEIVDFAGVEKFLDTPVKRYSSGMYVRLAFAIAAHLEPEILVVDEVLAVGDVEFQKKCMGKMESVAGEGRTVLFVSHQELAIRKLCTRAILLKSGKVIADGTPDAIFKNYNAGHQQTGFSSEFRLHSSPVCHITDAQIIKISNEINPQNSQVSMLLEFAVRVRVNEKVKATLEIVVKDENFTPILFIPLGANQNINFEFNAGNYSVNVELPVPLLANGKYCMDLSITETGIQHFDYIENALSFEIDSSLMEFSGQPFEQSKNQGVLLLNSSRTNLSIH